MENRKFKLAELTKREKQIAELIAWGASQKEVANKLFISIFTVNNTVQHIYEKTGASKLNELSAWWFCTNFNISFDLNPMFRSGIAVLLLCIYTIGEVALTYNGCQQDQARRRTRIERVRARRGEGGPSSSSLDTFAMFS